MIERERELFPSSTKPWDVDAALKPKRLMLLARAAIDTRNQALAEANREAGDTNWGIGCKAHERFAHTVAKLAATTERSWLRVHRDGLAFTSFVEGVAVRAFRGEADHPSARHVYAAQLESEGDRETVDPRQMALPFAWQPAVKEEDPANRWVWLMAVETDTEGRAVRVVFFQANALGTTRNSWIAPTGEGETHPQPPASVTARERPARERTARRGHSARVSARI